eukprot:CAMPEP_0170513082 /NCGR_PEP_ID=MMETSP0208-20121228/67205_1 /TAXON_ID=197538 /ORGANISM="Strombidium inclinatum, Strain S3" /LENGTH=61 /DNA_ID=CAMNT_0010796777 /DNA_START=151 /DNA_END=336 /DNA_ORIENTATION=-
MDDDEEAEADESFELMQTLYYANHNLKSIASSQDIRRFEFLELIVRMAEEKYLTSTSTMTI